MSQERKELARYLGKCLAGMALVFGAASYWHYPDSTWCLVSVLLVLSPDSREAVPLALTRFKANCVAAGVSVLCLGLFPANYFVIGLGAALTVGLCHLGRLMSGCRSALAALIIIALHNPVLGRAAVWQAAGQRLASVLIGCGVALLVTLLFHRSYQQLRSARPAPLDREG